MSIFVSDARMCLRLVIITLCMIRVMRRLRKPLVPMLYTLRGARLDPSVVDAAAINADMKAWHSMFGVRNRLPALKQDNICKG